MLWEGWFLWKIEGSRKRRRPNMIWIASINKAIDSHKFTYEAEQDCCGQNIVDISYS